MTTLFAMKVPLTAGNEGIGLANGFASVFLKQIHFFLRVPILANFVFCEVFFYFRRDTNLTFPVREFLMVGTDPPRVRYKEGV